MAWVFVVWPSMPWPSWPGKPPARHPEHRWQLHRSGANAYGTLKKKQPAPVLKRLPSKLIEIEIIYTQICKIYIYTFLSAHGWLPVQSFKSEKLCFLADFIVKNMENKHVSWNWELCKCNFPHAMRQLPPAPTAAAVSPACITISQSSSLVETISAFNHQIFFRI